MQAGIHKITYSPSKLYAVVHSYGCNFRCRGCSYKLLGDDRPDKFLEIEEIEQALQGLRLRTVYFMEWESTLNPRLPELLRFCKKRLGVNTRLGCTNGSHLPVEDLDVANVSFKAFDEELHLDYTGHSGRVVFENFRRGLEAGIVMKASALFIPGYIDVDQIGKLCAWLGQLSRSIPLHIMGYIPVPDAQWRGPTMEEMSSAVACARSCLHDVTYTRLSPEAVKEHLAHHEKAEIRVL